jgi:D-3-phosphoglycerate dehydrogenase
MARFVVLHTDPKLHPLDPAQRALLENLGATVMLLENCSQEFAALAPQADAVLNADFPLTAAAIAALRRCRVISRFGTGVDNIDVAAATAHRIPVANVPEFCTEEVANRTWTLLLACVCQLVQLDRSVRDGRWRSPALPATVQIERQTLGLIGFGRIARAVANRARAFGMKVIAFDPYLPKELGWGFVVPAANLEALLLESDFVSLHVPLTSETHHLLDTARLALMKPTATLINCGRGALVDEAALIAALQKGKLASAGLDVLEKEPPDPENPLFRLPQVVLTPHSAAHTAAALQRVRQAAVDTVVRVLSGQRPINLVNPGVFA